MSTFHPKTSASGASDPHASLLRAQSQPSEGFSLGLAANWLGDLENVIEPFVASVSMLCDGESDQLCLDVFPVLSHAP